MGRGRAGLRPGRRTITEVERVTANRRAARGRPRRIRGHRQRRRATGRADRQRRRRPGRLLGVDGDGLGRAGGLVVAVGRGDGDGVTARGLVGMGRGRAGLRPGRRAITEVERVTADRRAARRRPRRIRGHRQRRRATGRAHRQRRRRPGWRAAAPLVLVGAAVVERSGRVPGVGRGRIVGTGVAQDIRCLLPRRGRVRRVDGRGSRAELEVPAPGVGELRVLEDAMDSCPVAV